MDKERFSLSSVAAGIAVLVTVADGVAISVLEQIRKSPGRAGSLNAARARPPKSNCNRREKAGENSGRNGNFFKLFAAWPTRVSPLQRVAAARRLRSAPKSEPFGWHRRRTWI